MHMKWSVDVNFKTSIRPTVLSAIMESHDSTVTAIQWIHPMTKVSEYFNMCTSLCRTVDTYVMDVIVGFNRNKTTNLKYND